jgi:aspartyl-tRNA synthetase
MAQLQRRTHTCGALRDSDVGKTVTLNGWVNTCRVHPDHVFIDLRDRYGLTQVVVEAEGESALLATAQEIRPEWVLAVTGTVRHRLPDKSNPKLDTGAVEVKAEQIQVLNRCPTPPFEVMSVPTEGKTFADPQPLANEDLRLQYRYLDLRRPTLQRTLAARHRLNKVIRDFLDQRGFLELETPLLGRSTPEGARDYLVPSRVTPGTWYALPQSPQLYKQLLMVAGYDKYFQIAHCMRDEDLRADRQPEFTQLDVEMSFVEQDDVLGLIDELTADVFRRCLGVEVPLPLPRLKYEDAMREYGSDKPDLRYEMKLADVTDLARRAEFKDFQDALAAGGKVVAVAARGAAAKLSRKGLDDLANEFSKRVAPGRICYTKYDGSAFATGVAKYLAPVQTDLVAKLGLAANDLVFLGSGTNVHEGMGALRTHLAGEVLKLVDPAAAEFRMAWVVDFPSFFFDEEEKRWVANHHPFTSPQDQYLDILRDLKDEDLTRPDGPLGRVKAKAYDLVINGYEIGGGSIRIHSREVQNLVFRVLGMTAEQARQRFGFLLDALGYGAPPHGGIALGLDRLTMMLAGTSNIRDVIAFPKNQKARDLMTGAPSEVDRKQLKELGL